MIVTYRFDDSVSIVNLGDIHRGNKTCAVKKLHKIINHIADNPEVYWVSTGDLLETATSNSKSDNYDAMSIEDELNLLCAELEPIASKCLGFVSSNHKDRIQKEVGLNLDHVLADRAGIPFLGTVGLIDVVCGRCSYYIYMHHGAGGGSDGNKVNRAVKLAENIQGADIYLTGHTHSYSHVPNIQTAIDRKRGKVTHIYSHHVTTGHYIEYERSYAERLGLKAKPIGSSIVHLRGNSTGNEENKLVTPMLLV